MTLQRKTPLSRSPIRRKTTRKCKVCRQEFAPWRAVQPTCGQHECDVAYALAVVAKAERKRAMVVGKQERAARKADRDRLIEIQRPQYFLKKTERAVNAYCLARDRDQPCISCGTYDAAEWHSGHWIPVGRSSFSRYDPCNINKQCSACNVFKAGNSTEYEKRLPARIGQAEYERLKYAPREKKWSREELAAIETEYRAKLRELLREKA